MQHLRWAAEGAGVCVGGWVRVAGAARGRVDRASKGGRAEGGGQGGQACRLVGAANPLLQAPAGGRAAGAAGAPGGAPAPLPRLPPPPPGPGPAPAAPAPPASPPGTRHPARCRQAPAPGRQAGEKAGRQARMAERAWREGGRREARRRCDPGTPQTRQLGSTVRCQEAVCPTTRHASAPLVPARACQQAPASPWPSTQRPPAAAAGPPAPPRAPGAPPG